MRNQFGIYEKALPKISWGQKFALAKELEFDFIEMSIDESDERLARLDGNDDQISIINNLQNKHNVKIRSICFSGQRRYPMGSHDPKIQQQSLVLLKRCIKLAVKLNCHIIQLAGYDVFYESKDKSTHNSFITNLKEALGFASNYSVMLSIETMDDPYIHNIDQFLAIKKLVPSPWLCVYPDIGNLSSGVNGDVDNVNHQLTKALPYMTGMHIKDTLGVTKTQKGVFKKVPFGSGCVDFINIFKHLKTVNYQGSFMIEAGFEDYDSPVSELKQALMFVKEQLVKGGGTC